VTQNIDNLHERAGSKNLVHMHGELLQARCLACGSINSWHDAIDAARRCPVCCENGTLRVHVVWFGEMPLEMERIYTALADCDLFISIGTSGNVYPAAGFVQEARGNGRAHTVELNLEPSEGASFFHQARYGPATELVPAFVDEVLSKGW